MTDEELQEEQRRDFEARRDLAFTRLVCALNEGDAEIFDIEVEKNKEGEDVAWIYFRDGREVRKILRGLEEEKECSHQGSTECFGRQ